MTSLKLAEFYTIM